MAAGRIVIVTFDQVACAAAQDLFSIKASSTVGLELIEVALSQSNKAQDANDFQVRWRVRRGQTTQGSGGTTPTGVKQFSGDGTIASTIHANDTTQATVGTIETIWNDIFNDRAGVSKIWIPESRPYITPGTCLTIELPAAPSSSLTMNGTLVFAEIG